MTKQKNLKTLISLVISGALTLVSCTSSHEFQQDPIPYADQDSTLIEPVPGIVTPLDPSMPVDSIVSDGLANEPLPADSLPTVVTVDSSDTEPRLDSSMVELIIDVKPIDPNPVSPVEPDGNNPIKEGITEAKTPDVTSPVVPPTPPRQTPPVKKPESTPKADPEPEKVGFDFRNIYKDAYRVGEELVFDIKWGPVKAGEGIMAVDKELVYNNRKVHQVRFEAYSTGSVSWVYKVQDKYLSWLDKYGIYPWKFEKRIREGNYKKDETVEFDHVKGIASNGKKTVEIPQYTHDIISAFYYFRNLDLKSVKPGDVVKLSNYSGGKIYPLDVLIKGWEQVEVPAGTFNCIVLEPKVIEGGLFKSEGHIYIWLTNDNLRIPVKVETKVLIGSIDVELREIKGVNRHIPAKLK